MTSSKDVLTVVGMLCVSRNFRSQFFLNPEATAQDLVGRLRDDELAQVRGLAGGHLTVEAERHAFAERMKTALDGVYSAATCPDPPCPITSGLVDPPESAS